MINFHLICFGNNTDFYTQAQFCIASLKYWYKKPHKIFLSCSHPEILPADFVKSHEVKLIKMTQEQMTSWSGEYAIPFRIKLKAMETLLLELNEPYCFLDTDMFFLNDPSTLFNQLSSTDSLMFNKEFLIADKKNHKKYKRLLKALLLQKPELKQPDEYAQMYQQTINKTYAGIHISKQQWMWNSGVVGIAPENKHVLTKAIEIFDELMAAGASFRTVEQFCVALALQQCSTIHPAEQSICHYWCSKSKAKITHYLISLLQKSTIDIKDETVKLNSFYLQNSKGSKITKLLRPPRIFK